MKINKYVEDLRAKSATELNEELVAAKKELFNLRFQNATNQFRLSLLKKLMLLSNPRREELLWKKEI